LFNPFDIVADVRDINYAFSHDTSWGDKALALVGIAPFIGVMKNVDEATALVKTGKAIAHGGAALAKATIRSGDELIAVAKANRIEKLSSQSVHVVQGTFDDAVTTVSRLEKEGWLYKKTSSDIPGMVHEATIDVIANNPIAESLINVRKLEIKFGSLK